MDMVEVLRGQVAHLRAMKSQAEREAYAEEIKAFLLTLSPEQQFEHLKAIKTLVQEAKDEIVAARASRLAA